MAKRTLYIIRHGESMSNVGKWDFSKPDALIPLTDFGKEQAYELGKKILSDDSTSFEVEVLPDSYGHISGQKIIYPTNYFFTSPYTRAIQTTKGIIDGMYHEWPEYSVKGPTIIPDLMERNLINHQFIKQELAEMDKMTDAERFFYSSEHVESAMTAASRLQRTLYDIRNWSRSEKHKRTPMNIFVVTHSMLVEAWEYLEKINQHNSDTTIFEDKKFPEYMEGFGIDRRLKNCEYRKFKFYS